MRQTIKEILAEVTKCNFLDEENVFVDGTHIKASPNNKKVFAYSTNTACDKNNFVLGFLLTPGNYHDSSSFAELYQLLTLTLTI